MAYASKYYDPVKAHEYYEKHKKLKGRQKAKKQADADRATRSKKRKKRTSTKGLNEAGLEASDYIQSQIDAEKTEFVKNLNTEMKNKIAELKKSMAGMSEDEKSEAIAILKEDYAEKKAQAKEYFEELYAQQMDGLKADKSYSDGSSSSTTTKKSSSKSKTSSIDKAREKYNNRNK